MDDLARVRAGYDQDPEREWQRLAGGAQARLEFLITSHVLARVLPPPDPPRRVLDAGGGPGRYTLALARQGYRVTLLDLSPALLDLARRRLAETGPEVRDRVEAIVEGTITDLRCFATGRFDAVLCLGGPLSHLLEPAARARALRELWRVLRPEAPLCLSVLNRLGGFRSAVQWPGAWSQFFPRLLEGGSVTMGPSAIPVYTFLPEEFVGELVQAGLTVEALYGCQGLGAHLPEEHLLALMDDPERWPLWRRVLLETCGHPNVVGVSNHLLAVASRSAERRE